MNFGTVLPNVELVLPKTNRLVSYKTEWKEPSREKLLDGQKTKKFAQTHMATPAVYDLQDSSRDEIDPNEGKD